MQNYKKLWYFTNYDVISAQNENEKKKKSIIKILIQLSIEIGESLHHYPKGWMIKGC